jgi:hypothetical protein
VRTKAKSNTQNSKPDINRPDTESDAYSFGEAARHAWTRSPGFRESYPCHTSKEWQEALLSQENARHDENDPSPFLRPGGKDEIDTAWSQGYDHAVWEALFQRCEESEEAEYDAEELAEIQGWQDAY